MGESHTQPGTRYLKQIKQRSATETYGANNVCLGHFQRSKSFLKFVFTGYGRENDHLLRRRALPPQQLHTEARQLSGEGLSQRQIARQLNVAVGTVNKALKRPAPAVHVTTNGLSLSEFFWIFINKKDTLLNFFTFCPCFLPFWCCRPHVFGRWTLSVFYSLPREGCGWKCDGREGFIRFSPHWFKS